MQFKVNDKYIVDADSYDDAIRVIKILETIDRMKRSNVIDASIDYASVNSDDDYLDAIEKLLRQKTNVYVDAFIDNARGSFHISKNYRQKRNLSRDDLNKMIDVLKSSTDLKDLRFENPDRFDAIIRGTIPGYRS